MRALGSSEPWAIWYKGLIEAAELKGASGWSEVGLEDKLVSGVEIVLKGPLFAKRMWAAWKVSNSLLLRSGDPAVKEKLERMGVFGLPSRRMIAAIGCKNIMLK